MDDEATWSLILTDEWGPLVLQAVVQHVEAATVGERGLLVRTVVDPDRAPGQWVERIHAHVLEAIRVETGADLEALGSQAAWACYEQTWDALRVRWSDGGRLLPLRPEDAEAATALVARLPVHVARASGADCSGIPARPLRIDDVVLVDAEGLFAWIAATDPTQPDAAARPDVDRLLALARAARG